MPSWSIILQYCPSGLKKQNKREDIVCECVQEGGEERMRKRRETGEQGGEHLFKHVIICDGVPILSNKWIKVILGSKINKKLPPIFGICPMVHCNK